MKLTKKKIDTLKLQGFTGLVLPDECGCSFDDLAPCGESNVECRAGYYDPKTGFTYTKNFKHESDFVI